MARSKAQETELENRRLELPDDAAGELAFLEKQISALQKERDELIVERSMIAVDELQIRILLELLDEMQGKIVTGEDDGTACYEEEDFFRRTHRPKPNIPVLFTGDRDFHIDGETYWRLQYTRQE